MPTSLEPSATAGSVLPERLPNLLCGHGEEPLLAGYRARCPVCGSFWDTDVVGKDFRYTDEYATSRRHLDPAIGRLKVLTLDRWLRTLGIDLEGLAVCEVGFGGAACLQYLQTRAKWAGGIEVVDANLQNAAALGIPDDRLFRPDRLPVCLPELVDLWLFQDSYEHLPDPGGFLVWALGSSSHRAQLLLVAPEAGSLSDRILGRLWPHKLTDHAFHWSRLGITAFFERRGCVLEQSFSPRKTFSIVTAAAHVAHKLGLRERGSRAAGWLPPVAVRFNIGEMGLLFRRSKKE